MADAYKIAARALLNHPEPRISFKGGQFLGGLLFHDQPLTDRQERWLVDLCRKHAVPYSGAEGAA